MASSQYVEFVKRNIHHQLENISVDMLHACLNLVDYISVAPQHKTHLTFADFAKYVPESISKKTFIDSIYFLTKDDINLLEQKFEAFNPRTGSYEELEEDDIDDLIYAIDNKDYYNPITGNSLTSDEFKKQVLIFFTPSNELLKGVNND